MWIDPPPRLIWNASPSVPIGFYRVRVGDPVSRGELAVVLPPPDIARFLAEGGYLPLGLPLLKRVAALPEQTVCRTGDTISIDGDVVAVAQTTDRLGRALPVWTGCRTLAADQLFSSMPIARTASTLPLFRTTSRSNRDRAGDAHVSVRRAAKFIPPRQAKETGNATQYLQTHR
ncbi:S26 family signal peptidase [Sphingobium scionense]